MKPNIGRIDAFCRITMGLTMLACSTAKFVRKPMSSTSLMGAMMGGMKVAEGITRFCPLVCLAEQQYEKFQENSSCHHSGQTNHDEQAVNPS